MDSGGQPSDSPMKVFSPDRGTRPVARSARLILRTPVKVSKEREGPSPRAKTQASRKCQAKVVPQQSRGITLMKLWTRSALATEVDQYGNR